MAGYVRLRRFDVIRKDLFILGFILVTGSLLLHSVWWDEKAGVVPVPTLHDVQLMVNGENPGGSWLTYTNPATGQPILHTLPLQNGNLSAAPYVFASRFLVTITPAAPRPPRVSHEHKTLDDNGLFDEILTLAASVAVKPVPGGFQVWAAPTSNVAALRVDGLTVPLRWNKPVVVTVSSLDTVEVVGKGWTAMCKFDLDNPFFSSNNARH
ncbi:hypothetical protein ACOJUR_08115 [Alicyclobacillus tolerans]|uniref:hypothetical protein n=1 Tax=Alicyclobacillus tolerans TaxID=90970 RepID=UPI003B7B9233